MPCTNAFNTDHQVRLLARSSGEARTIHTPDAHTHRNNARSIHTRGIDSLGIHTHSIDWNANGNAHDMDMPCA